MGMCTVSKEVICPDLCLHARKDIYYNDLFLNREQQGVYVVGSYEMDSQILVKSIHIPVLKQLFRDFDGTRTVTEVLEKHKILDMDGWRNLLNKCYNNGFFYEAAKKEGFNEIERLSVKLLRYDFNGCPEWMRTLSKAAVYLFYVFTAACFLQMLLLLHEHQEVISGLTIRGLFKTGYGGSLDTVFGYVAVFFFMPLMALLHELGHLAVFMKSGGEPLYIALVLHLGVFPTAYVKQKSIYAFEKKTIMEVLLAGVSVNLSLFFFFTCIYLSYGNSISKLFAVSNLKLALTNLIPLSLTDGYFLFTILAKMPNLRMTFFCLLAGKERKNKISVRYLIWNVIYGVTILVSFNVEMITIISVFVECPGVWEYLLLLPLNMVFLTVLYRVNKRKFVYNS